MKLEKPFQFDDALKNALRRLLKSEPIQYITGHADFYGLKFKVNQHVLIPRPETEELVFWILDDMGRTNKQLDVLDIGVGSGCIGLTIKNKQPNFRLFGIEFSLDAMNVARINSKALKSPMTFYNFNFLDESVWPEMGKFHIIASNPPYISNSEKSVIADNVLLYEPHLALFSGEDPFVFYKKIEEFSAGHLMPGGRIYLELHHQYATEIYDIFQKNDRILKIEKDLQGNERMLRIQF